MTETKKHIRELKKALPFLKERITAAASLLCLSLIMIAMATYAWVTMSVAPEVSGIKTTAVANGNLEIALSDLDGLTPDESGVNDSSASQGIRAANTTWGNMINLSSGYGLEELILRPAVLDTQYASLLKGVKYAGDGRVEGAATDFGLTTWMRNTVTNRYYFGVPDGAAYGVRAISSVGFPDGKGELQVKLEKIDALFTTSKNAYDQIMSNQSYISTIEKVIQRYLDDNVDAALNGGATVDSDCTQYVNDLYDILAALYTNAICTYGDTLAEMANVQKGFTVTGFDPYTRDTLNKVDTDLSVNLSNSLSIYRSIESSTKSDLEKMEGFKQTVADGQKVLWSDLEPIINNLIDINQVTVEGKTATEILSMGKKNILSFVTGLPSTVAIRIRAGNLRKFEQLTGSRMNVTISFKISFISKKGNMRTNLTATDVSKYHLDLDTTEKMSNSSTVARPMVAQDTYGMVLDLWFRTNAGGDGTDAVLTLDGLPQIQVRREPRMIVLSGESESRPVYIYNRPTGLEMEGIPLTEEVLVYLADDTNDVDQDGDKEEQIYYDCTTYAPVYVAAVRDTTDDQGNPAKEVYNTDQLLADAVAEGEIMVSQKYDQYDDVVGFSSSNRVWNDGELEAYMNGLMGTEISATQGSGSCYVFYADSPESYASAVELLKHIRLAFVDANNTFLAEAALDTEHIFAESGKYTVPVKIVTTTIETENENGETVYGIAPLRKNTPQRISVVVYLNGLNLENNMVMAKDSIVGGLNLQFSTVDDLRAMKDTGMMDDFITFRVERTNSGELMYDGTTLYEPMTAYVEGTVPGKVELSFQRRINAVQGTQMEKIALTNTGGSVWAGNYPFKAPGTYVLSSVWVDGVEYRLKDEQHITVVVNGFSISRVDFCTTEPALALSVDSSVKRNIDVTLSSVVPINQVQVLLEKEDGSYVTANLSQSAAVSGVWSGTATFSASGTYTPRYVVADNVYYEIPAGMQRSLTAYLRLQARVYLQREGGLTFLLPETEDTEYTKVTIRAEILTDADDTLKGQSDVSLFYHKRGSEEDSAGLYADLIWRNGYYEGEFDANKGGIFNFDRLQVGAEQNITSCTQAPTVIVRDEKPIGVSQSVSVYYDIDQVSTTPGLLILAGSRTEGYIQIKLTNADTAEDIRVKVTDPEGNTHILSVADNGYGKNGTYFFKLPTQYQAAGGTMEEVDMEGTWTVDAVYMREVYDAEGDYYGVAIPEAVAEQYEFYVTEDRTDPNTGEVTQVPVPMDSFDVIKNLTVTAGSTADAAGTTGIVVDNGAGFLEEQTVSGLYVDIKPADGRDMGEITPANVKLTLTHDHGTNEQHGGYTFTHALPDAQTITIDMVKGADGRFVPKEEVKVLLAGTYSWAVTYNLVNASGDAMSDTISMAKAREYMTGTVKLLTVKSEKPYVTISSIKPSGPHTSVVGSDRNNTKTINVTSEITNNGHSAIIYSHTNLSGSDLKVTQKPAATLTVNMGTATKATMIMAADISEVRLFTNDWYLESTDSFVWESSTGGESSCERYIGQFREGSCFGGALRNNASVLTASEIELTHATGTYSVKVDTITITNLH